MEKMPKEIINEEEVPIPRVKKLLSQRAKEGELSFQQTITLEHASAFSRMAPAQADKLVDRLIKGYNVSRSQAVQVANIAPTTLEEMRSILDARSTDLTDEQVLEIVDIVTKLVS
ncbi:MAG: RNA polymerase Rpb4 family protein [Promethearchaeota archaeon]